MSIINGEISNHTIQEKEPPKNKEKDSTVISAVILGRREDASGKAKNAVNVIHWRVFSTPPDKAATGISGYIIS
ncbi:MAG: hypothetical protein ACYSOQ_05540 [Planctomycetota bacterium]